MELRERFAMDVVPLASARRDAGRVDLDHFQQGLPVDRDPPGVHGDVGADDVAHQLLDVDPAGAGPPPAPGVAWLLGSPPAGSPGRFGSVGAQCEKPARTLTQARA